MKSIKLIDFPSSIPLQAYEDLKQKLVDALKQNSEVISVYQLGSVNNPGISDLDILCVFENDSQLLGPILPELNSIEKSILTHSLFGLQEKDVSKTLENTFFTNFSLLYGKNIGISENPNLEKSEVLNHQIALEFLTIFYISLTKQLDLGIVKLRAFLLSAKALSFDLKLLNYQNQNLEKLIQKCVYYRDNFFKISFSNKEMIDFIHLFHSELQKSLTELLLKHDFFLPENEFNISKNVSIRRSTNLLFHRKGIILPNIFSFLGRKYLNLQNKWLKFNFEIPYKIPEIDTIVYKRFVFLNEITQKNKLKYPFFIPLSTGFNFFYSKK